jgi:sugar phosphate isomerase/epimerase
MRIDRSSFLKLLGAGAVVVPSYRKFSGAKAMQEGRFLPARKDILGLASYTLRKFSLDQVIEISTRLGIKHMALKDMHLPQDSTDAEIKVAAAKVRNAGINLYGVGVIYMKTSDQVENAFRYAKAAGVETIIGVPNHDLLPLAERKVKETDIRLAIHNHGPGDELYPSPKSIMDRIQGLDNRVGVCLDIGHAVRIGLDPAEEARRCAGRLYDIHLKDVNKAEAEGSSVEMGRGVIDIASFLRELQSMDYQGVLGLEYEKDADDPIAGLAESVGYARGVMAML